MVKNLLIGRRKISSSFQITIPEGVRNKLKLTVSDVIEFHYNSKGEIIVKKGGKNGDFGNE